MKYLSLFTGIGGFELGIKQAYENNNLRPNELESSNRPKELHDTTDKLQQWECVGYSEIDKYAIQVYEQHFNHKNYGDITKINADELPDFDLLIGGFPCQAFSIAGKRRGFEDTRGTLFFDIARILKAKQPRYFVLENVKGLLSHDSGQTFRTIIATLTELGYDLEWQVLNSKNFGVPQNRERVFIIGHLRGTSCRQVFPVREDDNPLTKKNGHQLSESSISGTLTATDAKMHLDGTYIKKINNPTHSNNRVYEADGISPTLNTAQGGNRQPKITIPVLTPDRPEKRQNGRRFKEDGEPSFTLTGQDKHGIYDGVKIRRLTPKECERLQGFPESEKCAIIKVCKHQDVNGAEISFSTKNIDQDNVVQNSVLIDCEENGVEIHSQGKLLLSAKNAEKKNWCHQHIKIDDFVQILVGINTIVEKIANNGEVVLHQKEQCLMFQKNGKKLEKLSGNEIMQPVVSVEKDLTTLKELLKSTTLDHSSTEILEQRLQILYSFVISAITGYIPKEILNQNTFTIEIKTKVGYTYAVSDTQRYKCCGNAVTVNVIEYIFRQLIN